MNTKIKQFEDLQRFLEGSGTVHGFFPSKQGLLDVLTKQKQGMNPIRMLYGETYDLLGITVDSLRYYLFVSFLHRTLQDAGITVESTILIADTASIINVSSGDAMVILEEGKNRQKHVNEIIRIYNLPIKSQLMSELFTQAYVQELIPAVQEVVSESTEIQLMLQKTILQNRIRQEDKTSYKYGAEAIATALLFDLKIGPPREQFYDEAAVVVAKKLNINCYRSIYLTPTYPLGLDFVYFLMHPEVEKFGLTPYKAGSNKLEDNRIILGRTSLERVYELVDTSFFPKQAGLPDPVGDSIATAKVAGFFLGKLPRDSRNRADAKELYKKFIHEPLKEVGV